MKSSVNASMERLPEAYLLASNPIIRRYSAYNAAWTVDGFAYILPIATVTHKYCVGCA